MPRYKLTVAYDGTDFHGWQKQEVSEVAGQPPAPQFDRRGGRVILRTVQEVLERAVREVVREPVLVVGASRTDAGVHAWGQVAAFSCSGRAGESGEATERPNDEGNAGGTGSPPMNERGEPIPSPRGGGWPADRGTERLVRAINSRLPADVLVRSAEVVGDDFRPIGGAVAKAYTYTMHASMERPLWDRTMVFHTWRPLDVAKTREAAAAFVGEHDFAAFAAAGHGRQSTVRRVFSCEVVDGPAPHGGPDREASRRVVITVSGSGFLYNMVRIIAGTLHEVGRGKIEPQAVADIIASRDRSKAGPTLPPEGLRLEWIRYEGDA